MESCGPKHCITFASFECTAQRESLLRPNPRRMCGPILHICSHLKLGVWVWEWETVRTFPTSHTIFPKLPSTYRTNFDPKTTIRTGKIYKLSNGVLRSGNGAVDAKLCLEKLIWPRLPKEGVTQWWGQPSLISSKHNTHTHTSHQFIGGCVHPGHRPHKSEHNRHTCSSSSSTTTSALIK